MSLADEWDAIPASSQPAAAPVSLADEWDAIKPDAGARESKAPEMSEAMGLRREPATLQLAKTALNQVTGVGASIVGGWRGLAALASGAGLEEAARQVSSPDLAGGTTARAYEGGSNMEKAAAAPGAAFGAVASKAGQKVYDVTGSPAAAATTETALNAVPLVLVKGGKRPIGASVEKVVGSGSIADEGRPPPPPQVTSEPNYDIPTVIRRRAAQEVPARAEAQVPPPKTVMAPGEPPPNKLPEPPIFADEAKPSDGVSAAERARREALLQRVGFSEARESAVTGNAKDASTDYQATKPDNSAGTFMRSTLDNERATLANHAENIVHDTGGTLGVDSQTLEARGHTILSPLEGFRQWFTDQTNGLYAKAREAAGGQPVNLDRFGQILGVDSKFMNTDAMNLRKGIQARMVELGMLDKDAPVGTHVLPATVEQAEALRQYINEEWTPQANGRIRELKNALDEDVTQAAGDDVFKQARALHAMKQSIFADPKGLSSILDSEGINRKVAVERIPDAITALPNAQFAHIVKTLQTVPPELRPQAQAALGEVKAQFANQLHDKGVGPNQAGGTWRPKDVTAYLDKNGAKMQLVFEPEEMAKIRDLNDAGHVLYIDKAYPGAAVQAHNLVQRGAIAALPKVGAATGGAIGAIFGAPGTGALVGESAGASIAGRIGEKAALRAAQKRVVKLGDFPK